MNKKGLLLSEFRSNIENGLEVSQGRSQKFFEGGQLEGGLNLLPSYIFDFCYRVRFSFPNKFQSQGDPFGTL